MGNLLPGRAVPEHAGGPRRLAPSKIPLRAAQAVQEPRDHRRLFERTVCGNVRHIPLSPAAPELMHIGIAFNVEPAVVIDGPAPKWQLASAGPTGS